MLSAYKKKKVVSGMAHITGGGLPGNVCRALGPKVDAVIDTTRWTPNPVFPFLQKHGNVEREEMFKVFNMGIGYTVIVRPTFADAVCTRLAKLGESPTVIGEIVKGSGEVRLSDGG
jgi:phosphoribosylformylglycinamidine cyclo-ligase